MLKPIVQKPCISCKFMHGDTSASSPPVCMHEEAETYAADYIRGEVKTANTNCLIMRSSGHSCGPDGKLYEGRLK